MYHQYICMATMYNLISSVTTLSTFFILNFMHQLLFYWLLLTGIGYIEAEKARLQKLLASKSLVATSKTNFQLKLNHLLAYVKNTIEI